MIKILLSSFLFLSSPTVYFINSLLQRLLDSLLPADDSLDSLLDGLDDQSFSEDFWRFRIPYVKEIVWFAVKPSLPPILRIILSSVHQVSFKKLIWIMEPSSAKIQFMESKKVWRKSISVILFIQFEIIKWVSEKHLLWPSTCNLQWCSHRLSWREDNLMPTCWRKWVELFVWEGENTLGKWVLFTISNVISSIKSSKRGGWESPVYCLSFKRPQERQRSENLQVFCCSLQNIIKTDKDQLAGHISLFFFFYAGKTIAVDVYVWLHKGAFRCDANQPCYC